MNVGNANVTPMMAQYLEIKQDHQDALLFYRMGDFYEMFFQDAIQAAAALDIALTKRGKHLGQDIPMCGVPVHSSEGYLLSLIRKGFRVAVCEQMEDPKEAKKRGSKAVVKREVVRVVTPGTLTEDTLLDARHHNFLAAWAEVRGDGALAWVDVSTGDFTVTPCPRVALAPQLARLAPREVLLSENLAEGLRDMAEGCGAALTPLAPASFDSQGALTRLCALYGVKTLDGFGRFGRAELSAMGAIIEYLELTQKGKLPLLRPPVVEAQGDVMQIDAATRRNLELTRSLSGGRAGSLLAEIDRTVTGAGARLLERRLNSPSTRPEVIGRRLDVIAFFHENGQLGDDLRDRLRKVPDIDRAMSRLALDRGGPRDIGAIRQGLTQAGMLADLLRPLDLPDDLAEMTRALEGFDALVSHLGAALVDEPPLLARDGGFVARGFDAELDDLRTLRDQGRQVIASLQKRYQDETGIASLKVKNNNVLGYFIETPSTHADRMLSAPLSETFIHRQTTANAVRFTTVELSEMEARILNAGNRALELELRIFDTLRAMVLEHATAIGHAARALAELDMSTALADLARGAGWTRPRIDDSRAFHIIEGRHPVVESALRAAGDGPFVANDCDLGPESEQAAAIWLLTGPNMAGKSTFLRQNALIALLAQMGSFVPAREAHIGLVTQLFSRVGASDDLARGHSTFMVEMVETAAILNQAGPRALVILDEIGRGTATYDGLSIAWATLEHLHEVNRCRTLFATHYHELTALSSKLAGMTNATVAVREWNGEVVFLHEVRKGAADRSYGVQVARLAGLPESVISRAREVLHALEEGEQNGGGRAASLVDDLPLFSAAPAPASPATAATPEIEKILRETSPDQMTPIEALNFLYELRDMLNGKRP